MTPPDFRALCAELVTELEGWCGTGSYDNTANAHSVIDRARAALAQSEPEGPTLAELNDLCEEHCFNCEDRESLECLLLVITDALARWGRPAPQPVPVSERLPGPGDCDEEGRCWLRSKYQPDGPTWRLACLASIGTKALWFHYAEWLPAHDLPLPVEVEG